MKKIIYVFMFLLIVPSLAIARFDLQGYYNKFKGYYGNVPLEDVAKDVYQGTFSKYYPDYNTWKKAEGIESLIQEDTRRRTPPPPSFLDKVMGIIPFRYDEESTQGHLYRYDRFTKTVQQRRGSNEDFKWVTIPSEGLAILP